jgi:3-isopropylmalate dehydratase small subunit
MKGKGRAHKFGDNVNTDEIIPARYLNTKDPAELGAHCMEDADSKFAKKVREGDVIVAGRNFGCGSSREHAPIAIKACGVSCVIAASFARIFYRNAINTGLQIVVSEEASKDIKDKETVQVNIRSGKVRNVTRRKEYASEAYPPFLQKIIKKGGLLNYVGK